MHEESVICVISVRKNAPRDISTQIPQIHTDEESKKIRAIR